MATVGKVTVWVLLIGVMTVVLKIAEAVFGDWFMREFYKSIAFTVLMLVPTFYIFVERSTR